MLRVGAFLVRFTDSMKPRSKISHPDPPAGGDGTIRENG